MAEKKSIADQAIDFIGDRWWLSFSLAILSSVYPVYLFGFNAIGSYSRRDTKIAAGLAIFAAALVVLGWLSFTSKPTSVVKQDEP